MTKFPDLYPYISELLTPTAMGKGPLNPLGVCVHYLADRDVKRAYRSLTDSKVLGYHVIIDRAGKMYQTTYFNLRVNHAGEASWNGLSPNRNFVAVALASWGLLSDEGKSWTGEMVKDTAKRSGNLSKKIEVWDPATLAQETELMKLLTWFVFHGINPKYVCGHDESATPKGRKSDPGGVLKRPMSEVRNLLELSKKQSIS